MDSETRKALDAVLNARRLVDTAMTSKSATPRHALVCRQLLAASYALRAAEFACFDAVATLTNMLGTPPPAPSAEPHKTGTP